jgi:hypothetical protein
MRPYTPINLKRLHPQSEKVNRVEGTEVEEDDDDNNDDDNGKFCALFVLYFY